ncbi:MAG: heme ABC exporter ATP-binding protein CcmA [Proteobacteria bacterium]|nr:heme ABC exporter ATP-binding protein CcmA [Pseudomonadota bacterium]
MSEFSGQDIHCFRGERTVFAGLGFALAPGDALVLRGPNGSGKSSLLRLMAGLARPRDGVIQWDGTAIAEDPEAHFGRLHYVGHADPVKAVLTVAENLAFWASLRTGNGGGAAGVSSAALDGLGIGHLAAVPGRFLSAGQKRRVNLARLLTAPAALWLLDEPATALDTAARASLDDVIARHRSDGGMVVLSSHTETALEGARELNLGDFQESPARENPPQEPQPRENPS